jgi:hypothetical protein
MAKAITAKAIIARVMAARVMAAEVGGAVIVIMTHIVIKNHLRSLCFYAALILGLALERDPVGSRDRTGTSTSISIGVQRGVLME